VEIILIILIILILGGGGYGYYSGAPWAGSGLGFGGLVILLLILFLCSATADVQRTEAASSSTTAAESALVRGREQHGTCRQLAERLRRPWKQHFNLSDGRASQRTSPTQISSGSVVWTAQPYFKY
jgi:hypothetical protein